MTTTSRGAPRRGWSALERAVGGPVALDTLDDAPLPDEPFDWTGIADDIHDRVGEVLDFCDRCCDELLDVEYRTACRRVLARIAVNGPEVFRRRGRSDTAAAAICWSVCRVNRGFDQRQGGFTQKALLSHFGLQNGSVSQRAGTLLDAGGFPRYRNDFALGSIDYLVSTRRCEILDTRALGSPSTELGGAVGGAHRRQHSSKIDHPTVRVPGGRLPRALESQSERRSIVGNKSTSRSIQNDRKNVWNGTNARLASPADRYSGTKSGTTRRRQ